MKFVQFEHFEKHLKEAFPKHFSTIYALTIPDRDQLLAAVELISSYFHKLGDCDILYTEEAEKALQHLHTPSLFGQRAVVFYQGDHRLLTAYLEKPSPAASLVLYGQEAKALAPNYALCKREMVWLDLSLEKPWEKKERFERYIRRLLQENRKQFDPSLATALLQRTGENPLLIEREIEKLLLYVGDRLQVTLKDVEAISLPALEEEGFQLAEKLIFQRGYQSPHKMRSSSELLALIGQLRYVLEQAFILSHLKDQLALAEDRLQLKKRQIERYLHKMGSMTPRFFREGLKALFTLECDAKSSAASPQILFDRFRATLGVIDG